MALAAHAGEGGEPKQNTGSSSSDNGTNLRENAPGNESFYHHPNQPPEPTVALRRESDVRAVTSSSGNRRSKNSPHMQNCRGSGSDGGGPGTRRATTAAASYTRKNPAAAAAAAVGVETRRRRAPRENGSRMAATRGKSAGALDCRGDGVPTTTTATTTTTPTAEEERGAARIRAQMSVLMVGFFEIIRQVRSSCPARDVSVSMYQGGDWVR